MDAKVSIIIAGLEKAYDDIRQRHPDAPPTVIVVYQPPTGTDKRGHYWRDSWHTQTEDGVKHPVDEILISSHVLAQGARSCLETLLHETAHAIAKVRGIQDTSRQGRYHNRKFQALAKEVGLVVEAVPSIGCYTPDILDPVAESYTGTILALQESLVAFQELRVIVPKAKKPRTKRSYTIACLCQPTVKMTVKKAVYHDHILCERCGRYFSILE